MALQELSGHLDLNMITIKVCRPWKSQQREVATYALKFLLAYTQTADLNPFNHI